MLVLPVFLLVGYILYLHAKFVRRGLSQAEHPTFVMEKPQLPRALQTVADRLDLWLGEGRLTREQHENLTFLLQEDAARLAAEKKVTAGVVVFITASSAGESRKIADGLLKGGLAACVNVVPGVASRYWWKGKIESGRERLLVVKTLRSKVPALIRRVKELHSYRVPEVIALPIVAGNPDYLRWINDSLKR